MDHMAIINKTADWGSDPPYSQDPISAFQI